MLDQIWITSDKVFHNDIESYREVCFESIIGHSHPNCRWNSTPSLCVVLTLGRHGFGEGGHRVRTILRNKGSVFQFLFDQPSILSSMHSIYQTRAAPIITFPLCTRLSSFLFFYIQTCSSIINRNNQSVSEAVRVEYAKDD